VTIWFTSEWHFGHAPVLGFGPGRPFKTIEEHDEALIENFNAVVGPDDLVWVLGDVALGPIELSLACCAALHGKRFLVCGNHDRPAMYGKGKQAHWIERYKTEGGFEEVIVPERAIRLQLPDGPKVLASHYPYAGESVGDRPDRYRSRRPIDQGEWLLHGHVHHGWQVRERQINVGVDVWSYLPVPLATILAIIAGSDRHSLPAAR
jgi:calcineurin-like phosphoesterase family protein